MSPLALVIDQGGHSSRAMVFAASGNVVAQASVPVNTVYYASGSVKKNCVEQDPAEIIYSLQSVIAQIARQLGDDCQQLCAAAMIVQRSSIIAWNKKTGTCLSPVLSWQDTRNSDWLEKILVDKRSLVREKTGLFANAHYGASKICWLLDNVSAIKNSVDSGSLCIAPLACFLQQQLTGVVEPVVDAVIASRTLLTALGETGWSKDLLDLFNIPQNVLPIIKPTLYDYGSIAVGNCQVPLRLLGGDQSFFALSYGKFFDNQTAFINVGTGAFIQQRIDENRVPYRLLCAPLMVMGGNKMESVLVAEGTVNAAATALDWLWRHIDKIFSVTDWSAAMEQAKQKPGDVPFFINRVTATGSPDWLPAGESYFSTKSSVEMKAIAVLESIVFALQRNLDCMSAIARCRKIIISGGLSQLDAFCQCLADLAGKSVLRSHDVEACARGAAMQILPELAGSQSYCEYTPVNYVALKRRYQQWSAAMDQLPGHG